MDGMLACTHCYKHDTSAGEVMVASPNPKACDHKLMDTMVQDFMEKKVCFCRNGFHGQWSSISWTQFPGFHGHNFQRSESVLLSQLATNKTDGPQGLYFIQLQKKPDRKKVNIDVDYGDGKTLKVRRVKKLGLLYEFNEQNPHKRVDEGDVFMVINGKFGDSKTLLQELLNTPTLEILVKKHCVFS